MRDKDQILLEDIYTSIMEAAVIMNDPQSLIGKIVEVHPAIAGTPQSNPYFMGWSIKIDKVIHTARTLHLKDCYADIKHDKVNKFQRNLEKGQKTPNVLVRGTIVDIDFSTDKLKELLSQGDWKSATYNPHKHPEYIYKDKLPEWWNTDERFAHSGARDKESVKKRYLAMKEREQEPYEYNTLSKKDKPEDNISKFMAQEILLKQYLNRGEDYMWVKGVHY